MELISGGRWSVTLASGFYASFLPEHLYRIAQCRAPQSSWLQSFAAKRWTGAGFLGTLEGLILLPFLPDSSKAYGVFLIASIAASCWICGKAEAVLGRHDDSRIILDEIVGFWSTMAFLPATPLTLLTGFVLFRVLDAFKFPPYGWLDRLPGGYGIVLDDVGAGLVANLLLRLFLGPLISWESAWR